MDDVISRNQHRLLVNFDRIGVTDPVTDSCKLSRFLRFHSLFMRFYAISLFGNERENRENQDISINKQRFRGPMRDD